MVRLALIPGEANDLLKEVFYEIFDSYHAAARHHRPARRCAIWSDPAEQMACRSDAGKFCAEHIGKPPQMNACLRENKSKLSDGCRRVVESHGG
ncbi:hypothetical protein ACVWWP_001213 [Bradyrhizobium sp. LM3.6]